MFINKNKKPKMKQKRLRYVLTGRKNRTKQSKEVGRDPYLNKMESCFTKEDCQHALKIFGKGFELSVKCDISCQGKRSKCSQKIKSLSNSLKSQISEKKMS